MKKILIGVLIILLIIMAYYAIFEGLSIGGFQILSVEQIADENDKLTKEIELTELLMQSEYPYETDKLEKSVSDLLVAKDEYLDLASVSTEGELKAATQEETYTQEFLWTRFGRHATAQGVNLNYSIATGTTGETNVKNLLFTVSGDYIPIFQFISALEDDSKLGFRIENFKLAPGGDNLQATFTVKNVKIKMELEGGNTTPAPQSTTTPPTTDTITDTTTDDGTNTTTNP